MDQQPLYTYVPDWPDSLRIVPARPLAASDGAEGLIAELDPGKGGASLVQPITAFKRELDARLIEWAHGSEPADNWLRSRGFTKRPSGRGVDSEAFIRWFFGPFWRSSLESDLCRVTAWACVGWNRHQRASMPADDALRLARQLDDHTRGDDSQRAIGHWFEPFPLVLMGEGKNRVDLYREHDLPLLVQLRIAALAPAASLMLKPVLGCDNLVALECLDASFWRDGERIALLPFPDLAVPLLRAYGVQWARGRHVLTPRSRALHGAGRKPWLDGDLWRLRAWRPSSWRQALLSQAYV